MSFPVDVDSQQNATPAPVASGNGKVFLVGAGPGDPDLITLKGLRALQAADVVVHDRLVSDKLLEMIPAKAIQIDVGKKPNHHRVSQSEISRTLVDFAVAGKIVVRLKGGDPFVFGRGHEEVTVCQAQGVDCEVVPGISSALAGPAVAGIPLTSRGIARSFAVITAESGAGYADPDHDFQSLAKIDTLVVLMGRRTLADTACRMIKAGRSPATPVACVERATLTGEKIITGSLATIASVAGQEALESPMVIVIGEVARFARSDPPSNHIHSRHPNRHRGNFPESTRLK